MSIPGILESEPSLAEGNNGVATPSECVDVKNPDTVKECMGIGGRSGQRKREFKDCSTVILHRIDDLGGRENNIVHEASGELHALDQNRNSRSKSEAGEDTAVSESPARRTRSSRQVQENLQSQKEVKEKPKKGGNKVKSVKKATKKRNPSRKSKTSKKKNSKKDSEKHYEVEKILKVKILKNGRKEFLIHWKGFSSEYDTWEPESNLNCKDLVTEYFKEHIEIINESEEEQQQKVDKKSNKKKSASGESSKSSGSNKGSTTMDSGSKKRSRSAKQSRRRGGNKRARKAKDTEAKEILPEAQEVGEPSGVDEDEEEKEFEVERILDVRHLRDGTRQFLIKWKGFAKKYNTWEPESNMNCDEKIEKFLKGVEESSTERELRVDRKRTNRFSLDNERRGRKMSVRLGKLPRKSYNEMDYSY